jgi:hypothetical protein
LLDEVHDACLVLGLVLIFLEDAIKLGYGSNGLLGES